MGFYLLNISVDTADLNPNYLPEDLSINDQESIIELVIEQVLGFEDAIKEYDDNDLEDFFKKKISTANWLTTYNQKETTTYFLLFDLEPLFSYHLARLLAGFSTIVSPPPQF